MNKIIPQSVVGLTLLLCVLPTESAFNWDHLGGPPPESNEPIAYETVPTKEPTPRYMRRIKEFLKRNRPRHAVEMLFPDNATELALQHKEIKANMTKDPTWAKRKLEELQREKGTSVCLIPDEMKNFTFPDMGVGTYDCSKTDEKLNEYIDNCHIETDYDKLKAKYDPHDVWNNKSINWGEPTYDDEEFDKFVQKRIESEERLDHMYENDIQATIKFNKDDLAFAKKWNLPLEERRRNMSLYGTWFYRDNITIIPERTWMPIEDLNKTMFDKLDKLDLDNPLKYSPIFMK
ncbi:hypothetical protein WDU94_005713 [Cyamophila willieti]